MKMRINLNFSMDYNRLIPCKFGKSAKKIRSYRKPLLRGNRGKPCVRFDLTMTVNLNLAKSHYRDGGSMLTTGSAMVFRAKAFN